MQFLINYGTLKSNMAISMKRNVESQDWKFDAIEKMHSKIGILKPNPNPDPIKADRS